jgi:hypothetical protein
MYESIWMNSIDVFHVFRLLKGADTLQLQKPIKQEFGGGHKIFVFDELEYYDGRIIHRFSIKSMFDLRTISRC